MKNRLKNYLKLGIFLFGISLLLWNCERDYLEGSLVELPNTLPVVSKKFISLDEFQRKAGIEKTLTNLSKVFKSSDFESRFDVDTDLFTVLTSTIIEMSNDTIVTYTFKIETVTDESSDFENFVVKEFEGNYTFYHLKYQNEENDTEFPYILDVIELNDDFIDIITLNNLFSKTTTTTNNCMSNLYAPCGCGGSANGHPPSGAPCCFGSPITGVRINPDCPDENDGQGGSGGGTDDPEPDPSDDIITDPINDEVVDDDNIIELNNLTNNIQIKGRIDQMVAELNTSATEQGSEFRTTSTLNYYSEYIVPASDLSFDETKFPPAIESSLVRVHMHHNTTNTNGDRLASVFSQYDIFKTLEFFQEKKDLGSTDAEDISVILVSIRGLYAFRVSDGIKLEQFYNKLITDLAYRKNFKNEFNRIVIDNTINYCDSCTDEQRTAIFESYFVAFFNQFEIGLTLFEATLNQSGNYTWSLLN